MHGDEQITGGLAAFPGRALPCQAHLLAIDHPAGTRTVMVRARDCWPVPLQSVHGSSTRVPVPLQSVHGREKPKPPRCSEVTPRRTRRTRLRGRPRLRARTVTGLARRRAGQANRNGHTLGGFAEFQGDLRFHVSPAGRPLRLVAAASVASTPEEAPNMPPNRSETSNPSPPKSENPPKPPVPEVLKPPVLNPPEAAKAAETAGSNQSLELVVLRTLVLIAEHAVGLGRPLELVLRNRIAGVLVGVILAGDLAVSLLYLVRTRGGRYAQVTVVVLFGYSFCAIVFSPC